jgi:hypothetical protein
LRAERSASSAIAAGATAPSCFWTTSINSAKCSRSILPLLV